MCGEKVVCLKNTLQSVATRMSEIVFWRVEEIFPAPKGKHGVCVLGLCAPDTTS